MNDTMLERPTTRRVMEIWCSTQQGVSCRLTSLTVHPATSMDDIPLSRLEEDGRARRTLHREHPQAAAGLPVAHHRTGRGLPEATPGAAGTQLAEKPNAARH